MTLNQLIIQLSYPIHRSIAQINVKHFAFDYKKLKLKNMIKVVNSENV